MGEEVGWPRLNAAAYWGTWATFGTAVRVAFRLAVQGPRLPAGPCVVVANHASFLDPVVLCVASRRRITFLMDAILCRTPPLRWFYRLNRVIPVDPLGSNRQALRRARAALARGDVLGVFPEGGISRDGLLVLGNTGAVSLALSGNAPVVPVGIVGAGAALPPHRSWPSLRRVRVCFGAALDPRALLHGDRVGGELAGDDRPSTGSLTTDPIVGAGQGGDESGRKQRLRVATRRVMDAIAGLTEQVSRESTLEARQARSQRS